MRESCITINCGCCGNGGTTQPPGTESGVPVGTIISYMGTKAPEHYLICDGKVLNIADYPYLSQQIQDEFGVMDYFGGDGTTTFAVPDLRNEFLRGYHEEAEQLSGDVGKHQDATEIPNIWVGDNVAYIKNATSSNIDKGYNDDTNYSCYHDPYNGTTQSRPTTYSIRPTNVAVLYCIKYE